MVIEFEEILRDLELKRAAALEALPAVGLPELEAPAVRVVDEDGGEAPLRAALPAGMVADALAVLAAADGEDEADTTAARAIVRAITTDVLARLEGAATVTVHDVSTLVEAALIAAGYVDIAKALVLRRALPSTSSHDPTAALAAAPGGVRLIRRSGEVAPWDTAKIERAIRKSFLSLGLESEPAVALAARVEERAHALGTAYVPIETVQDIVQEELVLAGRMRVAERYIVYRAERAMLRAREQVVPVAPPAIPVLEADGRESRWTGADLRERIAFASIGLELPLDAAALERELRRAVRPGIARADLRKLVVLNAKALMERDSEFSRFAGRMLLSYIYEETLGWDIVRDGVGALKAAHERALAHHAAPRREDRPDRPAPARVRPQAPRRGAGPDGRPGLRLPRPADAVRPLPDRGQDGRAAAPARGAAAVLAARRDGRLPRGARGGARHAARWTCTGSTGSAASARRRRRLFNAGTPHSQLSSCYVYKIEDTLSSIVGRGIAENAMCSKWAGGLGGSWTAVRGTGSPHRVHQR